jgi:hypothetical protein
MATVAGRLDFYLHAHLHYACLLVNMEKKLKQIGFTIVEI